MEHFCLLLILTTLFIGNVLCLFFTKVNYVKNTALLVSITALAQGVILSLFFDKTIGNFQLLKHSLEAHSYNEGNFFGLDGISLVFVLLTLFIFPFCFLAAWGVTIQTKSFFNYLLIMETMLVLTFTTLDILYFYVFFESLLIPMFIIIGVWGARDRKIKAAYYFFLYTLFGSLFMLFGILYLYLLAGSTNYYVLLNFFIDYDQQKILWGCFFLTFAVKMPMFPLHIWLPEAHVEAPTVGSMLLASLLLKLGGYGFLRFSLTLFPDASYYFSPVVHTLGLLGVVYGSLCTIRQIDLKRIVAYSSVAHMNFVTLGIFSHNQQGIEGAIYLMLAHGVVSTALFFCVGVLYDRYHSRLLKYYGGLALVMPLFSTSFFIFSLANMSFPATSNFLGEFLIFLGLFQMNGAVLIFASSSIVFSAIYSTWLFNRICFGTLKTKYISKFTDLTYRELVILLGLVAAMLFIGVSSSFILEFLNFPVKLILSKKGAF